MLEKFKKVDNPLTIIAIFAGITEVVASIALPFLRGSTQIVFVWFLILFPFALIVAFFITLNFNARVLYAPSDYRDDQTFLKALHLSQDSVQLNVTSPNEIAPSIQEVKNKQKFPISLFEGITEKELSSVNSMTEHLHGYMKELFDSNLIESYSFGIQGEGLFLVTAVSNKDRTFFTESRIINAGTLTDGGVVLRIIGQDIKSSDPEQFAEVLFHSLKDSILRREGLGNRDAKGKSSRK